MTGKKRSTNLPLQLTSFIGREREVAEVKSVMSTTRLLTLTGAGGSGKTRLALQVAAELQDTFANGVWLAEFAPLSDSALVPHVVADVLDLRESRGGPLVENLVAFLRAKDVLLVLDNCEHLVQASAELADRLLQACPRLKIIATSREALAIPGEVSFRVPTLKLPDRQHLPALETLAQFEAIRLFVERASAANPGFQLKQENAQSIAEICQRLDGIPLAIELAAVRTRTLSTEQIATRLDDRFRFLTAGSRTALARQKTLRATMDWSYDLLAEDEQTLLRYLSVFAGGWSLEAAEAICRNKQGQSSFYPSEVFDLLSRLVDKSLVLVEGQNGPIRYRMLETVREYAREKLIESDEQEMILKRHLELFVRFAEMAESGLEGGEQKAWIEQIEREYDNLRAAWTWAIEHDLDAAVRLGPSLALFWRLSGFLTEGRAWMSMLLERTQTGNGTAQRARVLNAAGSLASAQNDLSHARALYEESLAISRRSEDKPGTARALLGIGMSDAFRADPQMAAAGRPMVEQALALFEELRDGWHCAWALNVLGVWAFVEGDTESAESYYEASALRFTELGNRYNRTSALLNLAEIARLQGDYRKAETVLAEVVAIRRELPHRSRMLAMSLHNLGHVVLREGDHPRARSLFDEALDLMRDQGDYDSVLNCLRGLAGVLAAMGKPRQAAQLFAAVEALPEALGISSHMEPTERQDYERNVAITRAQLTQAGYDQAWAEGAAMKLEQAIEFAHSESAPPTDATTISPSRQRPSAEAQADLRIYALGPTRVFRGTQELSSSDWTYTKAREVFFFLLCFSPRTKEQIGLALWPDATPAQLRSNIKVTLYHLRRALGRQDWILFEDVQYSFNRSLNYWFDAESFETNLAEARRLVGQESAGAVDLLEEAIGLYRGDFLAGWTGGEWFLQRQEELQREYTEALLMLGQLRFAQGQYAQAAEVYRKAIAINSLLETAHRELMRSMARQGERGQALRHYQALLRLLQDEVDAPPAAETKALYERLRLGEEIEPVRTKGRGQAHTEREK